MCIRTIYIRMYGRMGNKMIKYERACARARGPTCSDVQFIRRYVRAVCGGYNTCVSTYIRGREPKAGARYSQVWLFRRALRNGVCENRSGAEERRRGRELPGIYARRNFSCVCWCFLMFCNRVYEVYRSANLVLKREWARLLGRSREFRIHFHLGEFMQLIV